jgi:hypothetical protein
MQSSRQPDPTDSARSGAQSACVALVPVATPTQWQRAPILPLSRPDPTFVTHLIATAEQAPQTRGFRRASPADAQTAYRTTQHPAQIIGVRTRQSI